MWPYFYQCIWCGDRSTQPWAMMVRDLLAESGVELFDGPKSRLKKRLSEIAVKVVLEQKRQLVSLSCMPTPQVWFKLQQHVCDSKARGLLNRLRAGDAGLDNRRPNIHRSTTKWCSLCLNKGLVNHLTEHHVVVSCQAVWEVSIRIESTHDRNDLEQHDSPYWDLRGRQCL